MLFTTIFFYPAEVFGITKIDNYSKESKKFINTEEVVITKMNFWENMKVMKEVFSNSKNRRPNHKLEEVKPNINNFYKSDETKFIWFGHSTLLMNIDGKMILVDPVFSNNASPFSFMVKRFQKPVLDIEELPNVDFILISHNHYDHLDKKTIKSFKDKKTKFLVPLGIGETLIKWGISKDRITELNWYKSKSLDSIKFTSTPAKHYSGRGLFDKDKTLWCSWVIEGEKEKIFYSGDSGYGEHFEDIGKIFGGFDLAFIENGQYDEKWPDIHMMPNETVQAAIDLKAKKFVPIHWGMFDLSLHTWSEPIENSYKIAKEKRIPIIIPKFGEIFSKETPQSFPLWWETVKNEEKKQTEVTLVTGD